MSNSASVPSADITRHIPHRPPFLFVDEIVAASDDRLAARLRVRPDFDFFRGHYPGNPIMPGVIVSESVFQAGALLLARTAGGAMTNSVPVLTRIQDARFRSVVRPGEDLEIEVELQERMGRFFFLRGSVKAGGRRVMTVKFSVALTESEGAATDA